MLYFAYMWIQHIPKPDAQFPEAEPPEFEHSSSVLQIPIRFDAEDPIHSSLGNETTENNEKAPEKRY